MFWGVLGLSAALIAAPHSVLMDAAAGKRDSGNTILLAAETKCSPQQAFDLWATSEGAMKFFAPKAEIGERVGGPYNIVFFPADDPDGVRHGTSGAHVLMRDPPRLFVFEWIVFAGDDTKGDSAPPYANEKLRRPAHLPTWVEIRFKPNGIGTHVDFRHYGFGATPLWKKSQAWFTRAWGGVLQSMKATCEKNPA